MGPGSMPEERRDARLMSEFTQRETAAAQTLYLRYAPQVYGIGLRTLHDPGLAADLVQDTFIKLWRRGSQYLSTAVPLDDWVLAQTLGVAHGMSRQHAADHRGDLIARGRTDASSVQA